MEIGWHEAALVGAAVLFLGYLVVRLWPGAPRRRALGADVRAARDRARAATTPHARAEALCEAGKLSAQGGARWTAAVGFFLRAMNSDPTWSGAPAELVRSFRERRPRLLEKILWRRLAHLPWDADHRAALSEISAGLVGIYERELRDKARAEVMRRVGKTFGEAEGS